MSCTLTRHAEQMLAERAFADPDEREPDPNDPEIERRLRRIPKHSGRVLRVGVDRSVEPDRIVGICFDRGRRQRP